MPTRQARLRYYRLNLQDFSGGINLRDSPSELAANEAYDCLDVTLDERGGFEKRLGITKLNTIQINAAPLDNIFYSPTLQILIAQQGARLFKSSDGAATWSELQNNGGTTPCFTDTNGVGFCEFLGKIVIACPGPTDGGIYSYDNTTAKISTKVASSPKASMCAPWQNRVFTAGDPSNPVMVTNTDAGALSYTTLGTTYNNDPFRTKDDSPITAIGGGQGIDVAGRSGLLVWKEESLYRINDSATLAYDTISISYGCSSRLGIVSLGGITFGISKNGILAVTDTTTRIVSDNVSRLFSPTQLALGSMAKCCAGVYRDRIVFSMPRFGATANNLTLEYHPGLGWIVPHSFAMGCYVTYAKNDARLFGCSTTAGYVYQMFKGPTDDGATISSHYQTRWIEPYGGDNLRLMRVRLFGRGNFTMGILQNFSLGTGVSYPVVIAAGTGFATYNISTYNTGAIYGPGNYEGSLDFFPYMPLEAMSFRFSDSSTASATSPALLGTGTADEVGEYAVYGIQTRIIPLEGI